MGSSESKPEEEAFMNEVKKRYIEVQPKDEKPIKIEKLWIFPLRGVMGIEVPEIKVSKWGIKYDREWAIYEKGGKFGCVTQSPEVKLTQLRQNIEINSATKEKHLVITIIESHRDQAPEGLPHELRIPIKHLDGEVIDTGKTKGISQG
jgi:tRNA(His) 5'-end guanylyltransferase